MEEIRKINIEDIEYPKLLKKISNPPKILYIKGRLNPDELCFAIVGTRRFSSYGKQVTLEIAGDLIEAGLTIVSGLAPGIDTFAHIAAIEKTRQNFTSQNLNRRAIAVLGTGLDEKSIYPKSNLKLARKILETGGALISEYPPGTRGTNFTFPQRNRIISGLSLGVLVIEAKLPVLNSGVEAGKKSGSGALITAQWAEKQGRKVFAIPGPIYSSNSRGCHFLIKKGAKLVENANDILLELKLPKIKRPDFFKGETIEENLILEALKEGALDIDKIIEKTQLSAAAIASNLAILEIKGKIRNLGGNIYSLFH